MRLACADQCLLLLTPATEDRQFVLRHPIRCSPQPVSADERFYDRELFLFNDLLLVTEPVKGAAAFRLISMALLTGLAVVSESSGRAFVVRVVAEQDGRTFLRMSLRNQQDWQRVSLLLTDALLEHKATTRARQEMAESLSQSRTSLTLAPVAAVAAST